METYEEKYKDLVKRLNKAREEKGVYTFNSVLDAVAPELKIDESEKIRKTLIHIVKCACDKYGIKYQGQEISEEKLLAWIEKQGEKKPTDLPNGEDYGIDGLWHAISILERTRGKVDGYQTDDGILEHECAISAVKKLYEQKPWSEEDEKFLSDIIKDLVNPWNEYIPDRIEDEIKWLKNKLKSLRPQNRWKPSDEQIKAVRLARSFVVDDFDEHPTLSEILVELEKQLKKLREE